MKEHFTSDYGLKRSDLENYKKHRDNANADVKLHEEIEAKLEAMMIMAKETSELKKRMDELKTEKANLKSTIQNLKRAKNTSEDKSDHKQTMEIDTKIENRNQSQVADNIIAKDISIECHLCKEEFANEKSIVEHKKIFHQNIKKCELCDKEFTSWKSIEDHFASDHGLKRSDIENYRKCKTNKKGPAIPFNIKVHFKMHGNCPKVTDTIPSLNHEKITLNNKGSNLEISAKREDRKQNQEADNTAKSKEAIDEEYEEFFDCEGAAPNINLLNLNR